jgi:hypothetical protein
VYVNTGEVPMPVLAPAWVRYRCRYCGHPSGLFDWQMADMPSDMWVCSEGKRLSLRELVSTTYGGSVNCLGK